MDSNSLVGNCSTKMKIVSLWTMNLFNFFKFEHDIDTAKDTQAILLTIFTLIAATTFQAGLNPPGGVRQEDLQTTETEPRLVNHVAGSAILSSRKIPYYVFLLSNTYAFYNSIFVILTLVTNKFPFKYETRAATLSMAVTYGSAVFAVTPRGSYKFRFVLAVAFLPFVIRFLIDAYKYCRSKKSQSGGKVVSYTSNSVDVKTPTIIASGVKSSPVYHRSMNPEIV